MPEFGQFLSPKNIFRASTQNSVVGDVGLLWNSRNVCGLWNLTPTFRPHGWISILRWTYPSYPAAPHIHTQNKQGVAHHQNNH